MENAAFEEYVKNRYQDQLNWYDGKAMWNQKWFRRLQWAIVVSAGLTPVVLVSHFLHGSVFLAGFAVALSVLTAACTAAMKAFKYEEHWLIYRGTCEDLRAEIHLYRGSAEPYSAATDREALFVKRVESLIARERESWRGIIKKHDEMPPGH